MHRIILSLTITVLFSSHTIAENADTPDEKQIRQWINELANARQPRKYRNPDDRLTPDERKALEPVKKAHVQLSKHFMQSLPYLMESLDDPRFSYPSEHPTSAVFSNRTVGAACRNLISQKVLLKSPGLLDDRNIGVAYSLPVNKEWYSRVKGMTLFEMQIDALDWLLKQPPLPGVSKTGWTKELQSVRAFREEFVANGEAADVAFSPPIEGK